MAGTPHSTQKYDTASSPERALPRVQDTLNVRRYSDFLIQYGEEGDKTLWVSKNRLCTTSLFFDGMIRNGFKEAGENTVTLRGDDPASLLFTLKLAYDAPTLDLEDSQAALFPTILGILIVADKYGFFGVKNRVLMRLATYDPKTSVDRLISQGIVEAFRMLYHTPLLKDMNVGNILERHCLARVQQLLSNADFQLLLEDIPRIGPNLLQNIFHYRPDIAFQVTCNTCSLVTSNLLAPPESHPSMHYCSPCFRITMHEVIELCTDEEMKPRLELEDDSGAQDDLEDGWEEEED